MRGYSLHVAEALRTGDNALPWVKLGRLCVDRGIPVDTVAKALQVSRQSVYAWFLGRSIPSETSVTRIADFIRSLD